MFDKQYYPQYSTHVIQILHVQAIKVASLKDTKKKTREEMARGNSVHLIGN